MFSLESKGSFQPMEKWLNNLNRLDISSILNSCGQMGVSALQNATPADTGLAGASWSYRVTGSKGGVTIDWLNGDIENGFNVVISLQYGYSTGTGGYVAGRDFINPAMAPIFDQIAERVWREVKRA